MPIMNVSYANHRLSSSSHFSSVSLSFSIFLILSLYLQVTARVGLLVSLLAQSASDVDHSVPGASKRYQKNACLSVTGSGKKENVAAFLRWHTQKL